MQEMLYEAVQSVDADGQRISQAEVQAALAKAGKSGGKITLNEISSMVIGIERACIEGKISEAERDSAIAQLEQQLEKQVTDRFNKKAKAYIDVLAARTPTGEKLSNAELIQRQVEIICSDGHVSLSERKALVLRICRDGKIVEEERAALDQALSKAWLGDPVTGKDPILSDKNYLDTVKAIRAEIKALEDAKGSPKGSEGALEAS
jgi:hypothetical protein